MDDTLERLETAIREICNWRLELTDFGTTRWRGIEYVYGDIGSRTDTDSDFFLSFHQCYCPGSIANTICFNVVVYALNFGICSGVFPFVLNNRRSVSLVSNGLDFLNYDNFSTPYAALRFSESHPECSGYSLKKLREWGFPYHASFSRTGVDWRGHSDELIQKWEWSEIEAMFS